MAVSATLSAPKRVSINRCELDAGAYLVLPTTFDPREEANFTLRVFSSRSLKFKVLDIAPKMLRAGVLRAPPGCSNFAQYEAIFLQLADEHRTIDPFQLQEILDACLPNDYIKSVASIETCRQIVLTLDVSFSTVRFVVEVCCCRHVLYLSALKFIAVQYGVKLS